MIPGQVVLAMSDEEIEQLADYIVKEHRDQIQHSSDLPLNTAAEPRAAEADSP